MADGYSQGDIPLVMGGFSTTTGTNRAAYKVSPHKSSDRGESGSMFHDFVNGQGLQVAVTWSQCPEPHICT